ncbi:MAG: DUF378 domain-containing protein [Candidatus Kaiserbacteria bacterium]|nr:DUF378 domain-containing protein [Candidatus Kaiserbacteria bacterium]
MIHKIAMILVLIGALNWGLVGVTGLFMDEYFNLVEYLASDLIGLQVLENIIYVIVGVSAVILSVSKGCCDSMMKQRTTVEGTMNQ